ncbi:hypothetical protein KR067_007754 [Drosophila pandora]|nr:hypothetical protein KR067_007754 [Drosophila pandora]
MAMLAEPRRRKRYNLCPRGKALYEDENRFGTKMLEKMGWSKGKGLGANEDGSQEFVRVRFKNDADGLGYEARDDQWTIHEEGFNGLLKSLNGDSNDNTASNGKESESEEEAKPMGFGFKAPDVEAPTKKKLKENISGMSLEEKSKQSKARVHYKKFTRGKDLSQYSEKDLANIFGKKDTSNVEWTPVQVEEPKEQKEVNPNFGGVQTLSAGVSVTDYFKQKMEAVKNRIKNGLGNTTTENTSSGKLEGLQNGYSKEDKTEESVPVEPVKKKKKKKDKERNAEDLPEVVEEVVEPAPKQKKKKSKSSPEEETLQESAILEVKEENQEDANPPRRKKKKNKSESPEEVIDSQNTADEPVPKKKKKSEKSEALEESQIVAEEPVPKKKKKSKKSELADRVGDETEIKESEPINETPGDRSEVVEEPSKKKKSKKRSKEEAEETTEVVVTEIDEKPSKKKKKSKASSESVPEDPSSEANPLVGEEAPLKKPKESKKKQRDEVSCASARSDDNSDQSVEEKLPEDLLSLDEIHERLKSFNICIISQFCADKFQLFDLNAFSNSTLASLEGYGFSENVDLQVVQNDRDKERILKLWKNDSVDTLKTEKKHRRYPGQVKRATIRAVKKRSAFQGI